jgi:hypothetical protein
MSPGAGLPGAWGVTDIRARVFVAILPPSHAVQVRFKPRTGLSAAGQRVRTVKPDREQVQRAVMMGSQDVVRCWSKPQGA